MTHIEHDRSDQSPATRTSAARSDRRAFFATIGTTTAAVTALTVGQTFPLFRGTNLLGPRNGTGPQQLPVNKTAASAEVEPMATDPAWRLQLTGAGKATSWSRDELLALPQTQIKLPLACVEGWSASALWSGVPLKDLLAAVGADRDAGVRVTSIQPRGAYRIVDMGPEFAHHPATLVALGLNGETLNLDHGFPARIMAPNRPGVLQTKWLSQLEVLT